MIDVNSQLIEAISQEKVSVRNTIDTSLPLSLTQLQAKSHISINENGLECIISILAISCCQVRVYSYSHSYLLYRKLNQTHQYKRRSLRLLK